MTETKKAPPIVLHIGNSFEAPEGAIVDRSGNKLARRVLRKRAIRARSRIEKSIDGAHQEVVQAQDVTDNGHAARRLLEKERQHRQGGRR